MTQPDTTPTVQELLVRAMQKVQSIGKKDNNITQGFWFRGIDAVMNAVGPAFRDVGLVCIPLVHNHTEERFTTTKGTAMKAVTIHVEYTLVGPSGDVLVGSAVGEAADAGDKATPKAMSVAYRSFLLQALCIPTHDPEPDAVSYERAVSPPQHTDPGLLALLTEHIDHVRNKTEGEAVWKEVVEHFDAGQLAIADRVALRERAAAHAAHLAHEQTQDPETQNPETPEGTQHD